MKRPLLGVLTIQPHVGNQTHPCIAPDGSYIIFDINVENGSLFVSFKDKEGHWGDRTGPIGGRRCR